MDFSLILPKSCQKYAKNMGEFTLIFDCDLNQL